MRFGTFAVAGVLAVATGRVASADNALAVAAARDAVAGGQVDKTRLAGFTLGKDEFRQTRAGGGVLVGFDVGVGSAAFGKDGVFAVRPIFLTEYGALKGNPVAPFETAKVNDRVVKSRVTRTVTVSARSGYAVAGLSVRSAVHIAAVKLTFARIDRNRLDLTDFYESDWVGDRFGGGRADLSTGGRLPVGVTWAQDEAVCLALGLVHLSRPEPAEPPARPSKR